MRPVEPTVGSDGPAANVPHVPLVGRNRELQQLAQYFEGGGRVALVTGSPGCGKTELARVFGERSGRRFPDGVVTHVAGESRAPAFPQGKVQPYLFIIDNVQDATERGLAHMWDSFERDLLVRLLLVGEHPPLSRKGFDFHVELKPLTEADVSELVRVFAVNVDSGALRRRTAGNAMATVSALRKLAAGATWEEYLQSLSNVRFEEQQPDDEKDVTAAAGVVPPIIADVEFINEVLARLAREPVEFYKLHPRKFEEVVAEILSMKGYKVTLTPESKDRGFDMYAARNEALGEFVYLVECKRYSPEHKVGVHIVRSLQGVVAENRATAAALITTSFFTRGAREFQRTFEHTLKLHDYQVLQLWLRQVLGLAA